MVEIIVNLTIKIFVRAEILVGIFVGKTRHKQFFLALRRLIISHFHIIKWF